jgi:predicted nucleic-acid-binding Zn-ribbon protein
MMTKCPACGSTEIVQDLRLFGSMAKGSSIGFIPDKLYATLVPHKGQTGEPVIIWLHADICGGCGHAEIYSAQANEALEAHKKGYISKT